MAVTKKQLRYLESIIKLTERMGRNAFTVSELHEYMKSSDPKITYRAVHTTLRRLMEKGMVKRIGFGVYVITSDGIEVYRNLSR